MKPADVERQGGGLVWYINPETELVGVADSWHLDILVQDCLGDSLGLLPVRLDKKQGRYIQVHDERPLTKKAKHAG